MKFPLALPVLLVCLVLSACGAEKADSPPVPAHTAVSPLGQAAGIDPEVTLLTVGDQPVPAWQFLYWLAADYQHLEERYAAAGKRPAPSPPLTEGASLGEMAREAALLDTALCVTVETWAKQYECMPTETDALPQQTHPWLTQAQSRHLSRLGQAYAALFALYCQEGSPLAPSEEALSAFERDSGLLSAERIFIPMGSDPAAARETAGAAFATLNAAQDPEEAFRQLMEAHGGGPLADGDWTPTLQEAAEMLAAGQWSGILAAGDGYSILRRTALPRQRLLEAHFDQLLQRTAAAQEILVSADYAAIDPQTFWEALGGPEASQQPAEASE